MKIALLLPSRQRLNKFLTFLTSVVATAEDIENISIILGIDEDDPCFEKYKKISNNLQFVQFLKFPKETFAGGGLSAYWNTMVKQCDHDILAMVGDDMIFKTDNWDTKIVNTFNRLNDNIHLIHCNDGMRGPGNKYANSEPFAVNSFVHRDYVDSVGRYVQDMEPKAFQDTYLDEVFKILGRKIYFHDIIIKHVHFSEYGNGDETTEALEKDREGIWDNNSIWNTKLRPAIEKEVKLLKKQFNI